MGEVVEHPSSGIRPPERISADHDLSDFDCGEPELNAWLRERAVKNDGDGGSRTYVVCAGKRVVGFYCIANGAIMRAAATKRVGRNMPDPVPAMVIGRMGVALPHQGQGIGSDMLRDAVMRTVQAAEIAGIRAILVHAKSDRAKQFYEDAGFSSSPIDPMTLMITVAEAERALRG